MVQTIEILGIPHAYELTAPAGSSPTLVFVHGWLLSQAYWQPLIQRLASDFQCLSYDLRGFGGSQPDRTVSLLQQRQSSNKREIAQGRSPATLQVEPALTLPAASHYTPAAYAQDLISLLEKLNIRNAWLVGHSLGGSIALWAADQCPQIVQGVVCVNSGGGIYLKEEFERFRAAGEQLVKLRPRWLSYLPLVDLLMTRMNVAQPIARQWGRQRLLDLVRAHPEAALGALLDSTTEEEVHYLPQVVSRLRQPVYFISGANDDIMEPQYVRHLASFHHLFQHCGHNVVEISECGHLAMVEQPDAVTRHIRDFLHQN